MRYDKAGRGREMYKKCSFFLFGWGALKLFSSTRIFIFVVGRRSMVQEVDDEATGSVGREVDGKA